MSETGALSVLTAHHEPMSETGALSVLAAHYEAMSETRALSILTAHYEPMSETRALSILTPHERVDNTIELRATPKAKSLRRILLFGLFLVNFYREN
ncbi:hypothetical protein SDJN03_07337, partial [Cucurbita argyrosperma subsp. sororia]